MKDFSVSMALVDFIPVICFMIAAIILQRDLYNKMYKGAYALFACGTIDVIFAGGLKALYKLLYALGICDFLSLSELFMPLQSLGFLLAGMAVLSTVFRKDKGVCVSAVAPPLFKGVFVFVGCMVLGLLEMIVGLSYISVKMKKYLATCLFIISLICSIGMGYLSSKNFEKASMNWIAEGVNIVGQGTLLIATYIIHKAGLKNIDFVKSVK